MVPKSLFTSFCCCLKLFLPLFLCFGYFMGYVRNFNSNFRFCSYEKDYFLLEACLPPPTVLVWKFNFY